MITQRIFSLLSSVLLLFLLCSCGKHSEKPYTPTGDFDVHVSLTTNVITMGETVEASISVYHPPSGLATIPELDHRPEIVVRNRQSSSEAYNDSLAVTRVDYTLTSYRVGIHALSTGVVNCAISGSNTLTKTFPAMNLVVNSVLTNQTSSLQDIRPIHTPKSPFPWMMATILAVVLLAIVLAVLIALLVKKPAPEKPLPPPTPPHTIALKSLDQLRNSGMIEERQFEPFYVQVSSILRTYIEGRFSLDAPDMTTEEFIQEASQSRALNSEHNALVSSFLEECDMVKFAKMEPDEAAMLRVWDSASRFVNETTPGHSPFGPAGGAV